MVRKTNKEHKDVSVQITRFKNEKSRCDRSDFLKSQKKKPSMPLDHLKDKEMLKNRRLQKRNVKRENQRRKDVSLMFF